MVCHMGIHQLLDLLRKLSGIQRADGISLEYRIGLYNRTSRQIGNLMSGIGNIDIADLAGQSAECLDQLDTFLPGRLQLDLFLTGCQSRALCQTFLQILLSPVYGSQTEFPSLYRLGIFQVTVTHTGHEFHQMPVACCCDQTIFAEQIKFHNMGTLESRVRPVFICFFVAVFLMLLGIFPVNGKQIDSLIGSIVEPGKMVDTQYIDLNILTFHILKPHGLFQNTL